MERFFKSIPKSIEGKTSSTFDASTAVQKKSCVEFDPSDIIVDPWQWKFSLNVGVVNSNHNNRQNVSHIFSSYNREMELAYRDHVIVVLHVVRFLMLQGWKLKVLKELVRAYVEETMRAIIDEIRDSHFFILLDESCDKSIKEQMVVIVMFVNEQGQVIERFLAVEHVVDTLASSLKPALNGLFARYDLYISRLRGQGYDGASNIRGRFNGFLCPLLYHQLYLVVISVARSILAISDFFSYVTMIVNIVGASCKRRDALLQKHHDKIKFQYIVNAMGLIVTVKKLMQDLRENGWSTILEEVRSFCVAMSVLMPNMENKIFIAVIDLQTVEMNSTFSETSTELLRCFACLDPRNSFSKFDHGMLVRLAQIYSDNFSTFNHLILKEKLHIYIHDLAKLKLILLVATKMVERAFSAMNIIKTDLRNKIGDKWLNNMMVCYIEREMFAKIDEEIILQCFQTQAK
ncbi:Ribonuclease H-like protein [Dioscorea alata]|uniref:Ribonuclease H-like protein n=1 Tax=Dioscorea alata TaxID=55571 RepID=A0ACB7VXG8_DIOAL|nr:Ribonuclease H-like protein [Dioscorea alata]